MWQILDTHSVKMLAILAEWKGDDGCLVDNTPQYLFLVLFKLSMDTAILLICWRRLHTSFLSVCGLSIVLADAFMALSLAMVWTLNPLKAPVSVCFLLANFSAVFSVLPLPMIGLGLLDYFLHDKCTAKCRPVWMLLRNTALASLVWLLAALYSYETTTSNEMEITDFGGLKALVCEVPESQLVNYFVVVLLLMTIYALLPHISAIPAWYRKANLLSEQREKPRHIQKSDLRRNTAGQIGHEDAEANPLVETTQQPPCLWISLVLCFASVWLPYLFLSAIFVFLGVGIPTYVMINLLWLECTNSLLVGVIFWLKSNDLGQYNSLPDEVCSWRTYLHLSRGTYTFQEKFDTSKWKSLDCNANTVSQGLDHVV